MKPLLIALCLWALPCWSQDQLIPFHKIDAERRSMVEDVYYAPTVRILKNPEQVDCELTTLTWVLDRLPLASRLAQALDLGDYGVVANPEEEGAVDIDDREGALATMRVVYQQPDIRVYLANGSLESRALPTVDGTGLIVLYYDEAYEGPGLEAELSVFFRLKSDFLHLVTRAFTDQLERELNRRLVRLIRAALRLAENIEKDPEGVFARLQAVEGVEAAELEAFEEAFLQR